MRPHRLAVWSRFGGQSKSLELRAGMNLSRLWHQQGKRDEACALLALIYGWFTEGLDTADLQEAKALLEELEGKGGAGHLTHQATSTHTARHHTRAHGLLMRRR